MTLRQRSEPLSPFQRWVLCYFPCHDHRGFIDYGPARVAMAVFYG